MRVKQYIIRRKVRKAGGITKAIQKGVIGFHVWSKIEEQDGKYIIKIQKEYIDKGLLTSDRLYNISFKLATNECPLHNPN